MSQHQQILRYLKSHKRITPWTAYEFLRITKLATRVSELIRAGHKIKKRWLEKDGARVMSYSLGE